MCVHACLCAYMCVCVCVYVCVHTHMHLGTHVQWWISGTQKTICRISTMWHPVVKRKLSGLASRCLYTVGHLVGLPAFPLKTQCRKYLCTWTLCSPYKCLCRTNSKASCWSQALGIYAGVGEVARQLGAPGTPAPGDLMMSLASAGTHTTPQTHTPHHHTIHIHISFKTSLIFFKSFLNSIT